MSVRHRWGEKDKHADRSIRSCLKCGLLKVTRHEPAAYPMHWIEYWRGTERVDCPGTPPCAGPEALNPSTEDEADELAGFASV